MSIETTNEELGNKLFCDLKNDAEKANFFLSGRGYETGVIAKAIQNDVAMTYHRCAVAADELRRLRVIEAEWASLSQDHGKHEREVERLSAVEKQRDELLEALKNYVDGCSLGVNAAEVARAAIAKAEGKV